MSKHSAKKVQGKLLPFFLLFFWRRVLTNWELSITLHTVDFTVKKLHLFLQFIDYFLHSWSRPRLSLQASPYQATKRAICYKHHLFFTPSRMWRLPDTHFTKKNTKAVNINLTTTHHSNKSIFFPWDVCGILRLKSREAWFSLHRQYPGQLCTRAELNQPRQARKFTLLINSEFHLEIW